MYSWGGYCTEAPSYNLINLTPPQTVSSLGSFFFAMATHPEIQKRAQHEIDTVIGTHRLPEFADRPSLPFVEALYREVMRFKPVLPLGVAHASTADDIYEGYFIPKGGCQSPCWHIFLLNMTACLGATVISNIW